MDKNSLQNTTYLLGLVFLFLIAPFYSQPNIGGAGLALTYNISIWAASSWLIVAGIIFGIKNMRFQYPKLWVYFIAFPFITIINSLLVEVNQPITWIFRQLYILGGVFFLFALFQFQPKQAILDRALFILVIAAGLHASLGTMQVVVPNYLPSYFPPSNDLVPRGMFQQINVQASFLTTGLIVSLYLISRPSFKFTNLVAKSAVVITFTLCVYVVIASGSRIALLSLLLGIPLILWSRFRQLRRHKRLLVLLLITSCSSFLLGQAGLHKTLDKTAELTDKSYSTARIAMYTIGLELVTKEPLHGYGIGYFLPAWNKQASDYVSRYPETKLPQSVNHPHNEILFWMIEAGLPALLGFMVFALGIIITFYRCGFQRGGTYAAMLLPISFHTQVELPFYISSLHWFTWLFLIYLALRHQSKSLELNLSWAMERFLQIISVVVAVGLTLFLINTARAQADLYDFLYNKKTKAPYLQVALNNIYTKPYAEQVAMRSMLYSAINDKDTVKVREYERWALKYIEASPELKMYEDLISASVFLRPEGKGCDAILAGLKMYAQNKALQKASMQCTR